MHAQTSLTSLRRALRAAVVGATLLVALGCSNDKEVDPPAELVDIVTTRDVQRVWNTGLGGKSDRLRLALQPRIVEGVVYTASHGGEVVALAADTGRRQWQARTRLPLSAGPEVGGGLVILGSSDGDIIALDQESGAERWRRAMASEVLARPLVVRDIVVVRTVNGNVEGLSVADGSSRWAVDEQVPRLTLRGNAPPVLAGDRVIVGFDSGKVLAIDPRNGEVLWDTVVSVPSGRTELERLADIDAAPRAVGEDIYVAGFQGRLAMLARESGQIWWARDASSYRGFAMDEQNLYLTDAASVVIAMRRNDGAVVWEQDVMRQRGLTAPAIDGDALVVGDFEGYVHWLDKATGELQARQKTDGARITNAPVVVDGLIYLQTDAGRLQVYRSVARDVSGS